MDDMSDDGAIAIEALKAMKKVLAAAMAKMPEAAAEAGDEPEIPEDAAMEAESDDPAMAEMAEEAPADPVADKMTVLETVTPSYSRDKGPPMDTSPGKLKAKKKKKAY